MGRLDSDYVAYRNANPWKVENVACLDQQWSRYASVAHFRECNPGVEVISVNEVQQRILVRQAAFC